MIYDKFLYSKEIISTDSGFDIDIIKDINPMLFDFQKVIVRWCLKRGRSAIFADCGLGKTAIQLEWAVHVHNKEKKPILICAPLAVSNQTKIEGEKFGIHVNVCRKQEDVIDGINITNYEMLSKFNPSNFCAIVLDESSILKGFDRKYRTFIINFSKYIPYRLACTATPAPNDIVEINNHAEFLGIMSCNEIIGLFFIQDGNVSHKFRLKKHAINSFWKWMSSWSLAVRFPSDLGFENNGFILPKLYTHEVIVNTNKTKNNGFFSQYSSNKNSLKEYNDIRKRSLDDRVRACADLVNKSEEQWIVWCNLNIESEKLKQILNESVEIKGSDSIQHKEDSIINFQNGKIKVLITKPSITGFGINLQMCSNMVFVGLSHSYEKLYQATRRCWRFGQKKEVNSYHIVTENEYDILRNIKRKEEEASKLFDNVIKNMNLNRISDFKKDEMKYENLKEGRMPIFLR